MTQRDQRDGQNRFRLKFVISLLFLLALFMIWRYDYHNTFSLTITGGASKDSSLIQLFYSTGGFFSEKNSLLMEPVETNDGRTEYRAVLPVAEIQRLRIDFTGNAPLHYIDELTFSVEETFLQSRGVLHRWDGNELSTLFSGTNDISDIKRMSDSVVYTVSGPDPHVYTQQPIAFDQILSDNPQLLLPQSLQNILTIILVALLTLLYFFLLFAPVRVLDSVEVVFSRVEQALVKNEHLTMRHPYLSAVTLLALFLFLVLGYDLLYEGRMLSNLRYPWIDSASNFLINGATAKYIHDGLPQLALWADKIGIGIPLYSDPNNSFFSPFSFLLYLFPGSYGWDGVILLRMGILMLTTLMLLLHLRLNPWVSCGCAVLLGFSGHVYYFMHILIMNTLPFVPLFILGIIATLEGQKRRGLICLGIATPLMFFGGSLVDIALLGVLTAFLLGSWSLQQFIAARFSRFIPRMGELALCLLIAALLAAPFLVPYFELRRESIPPIASRSLPTFDSLLYFVGLFMSKICQTPRGGYYYMEYRQFLHIICIPGFFAALVSLFSRRQQFKYVIVSCLFFFFFYFFKLYGFSFMQVINHVPVLQDIRFEKYQGIYNIVFYILAAVGYDYLLRGAHSFPRMLTFFLFPLVAVTPVFYGAEYGLPYDGKMLPYVILPLVILLLYLLYCMRSLILCSFRNTVLVILLFLAVFYQIKLDVVEPTAWRKDLFHEQTLYGNVKAVVGDARILPLIGVDPRTLSAYGLNDVRNISVVHTRRYYEFFKKSIERNSCWHDLVLCSIRPDLVDLEMAEHIGVRYILVSHYNREGLLQNPYENLRFVKKVRNYFIYELGNPTEYFYGTNQISYFSPEEVPGSWIDHSSRNRVVYLEKEVKLKDEPGESRVSFGEISQEDNRISAEVHAESDAVVVIGNQFFPGWHAYLDGKKVELLRGNYLFQALVVPSGTHRVEIKFMPYSLIAGVVLCGFGLILALFFLWGETRSKVLNGR